MIGKIKVGDTEIFHDFNEVKNIKLRIKPTEVFGFPQTKEFRKKVGKLSSSKGV